MSEPTIKEIFKTLSKRQRNNVFELIDSILNTGTINMDIYRKCMESLNSIDQDKFVKCLINNALATVDEEEKRND